MININDRFMTGAMYAPFCRTKHAPLEEFDRDMKTMSELGYTCLHGFAEWHDIEYEKGHYDFTKIDHFVDCAAKNGLVPLINIATHNGVGFYSPRWLMEEYRGVGTGYVDALGQSLKQEEYVIPCIDDPVYQGYARRYLAAVAKHFAGDERVGGFILWGEPDLFSPRPHGDRICYCVHTKEKFRRFLKERYGRIEALNEAWGTEGPSDYIDFAQVNPPTGPSRQLGGFRSWDDWLDFMESNLADHIKAADRIFKENGATQPTIVEMLTGIDKGIDSWKLAESTDIVGLSMFGYPDRRNALNMAVSDSISKAMNKSTFVIEASGGTFKCCESNPAHPAAYSPTVQELKSTLLMRAGYGTKGLMYWCWRPRLSDVEGNDFGMCKPNGQPLARTRELGRFAKRMEAMSSVYNSAHRHSDVAIYMSQKINHMAGPDFMMGHYIKSLCGANYMLTDLHINSDFVTDKYILEGALKKYKVLLLPCTYVLSEETAAAIAEFVRDGGHVIADYLLAEKYPGGGCYIDRPGGGLDRVFGIEREDVFYIPDPVFERENTFGVKIGSFIEEINLHGAESVAGEYMPGYAMMTEHTYGKGRATYITTQYFSCYEQTHTVAMRERMAALLAQDGITSDIVLENEDTKEPSNLVTSSMQGENGGLKIVTVSNTSYTPAADTMILPSGTYASVDPASDITITNEGDKTRVRFTLGPREALALYAE